MTRLKGSKDLVFDAIEETTKLVARMHALVSDKSASHVSLGEPMSALVKAVKGVHDATAAGVYESIRLVNQGIHKLLDGAANPLLNEERGAENLAPRSTTPLRSDAKGGRPWLLDHAEAALNALCGDYLAERKNALDLGMSFRHQGKRLPMESALLKQAVPDCSEKACIFIHGLACTEWSWSISAKRFYGDLAVTFGSQLKADLGYTPWYVRYNSGCHISQNGRRLSHLLTQLVMANPCELKEIVLVGHSMGGLVARSAAFYGHEDQAPWTKSLRQVFCVGSPNLGAPIEKATNLISSLLQAFNTVGTQVPAQILNGRSAGIKDLRFGYTVDDEWRGKDPDAFFRDDRQNVPLLDGVGYSFLAATLTRDPNHPLGILLGDLAVHLPSATGDANEPVRRIPFTSGNVFGGMNHLHLTNHPDVVQAIRRILEMASR